MISTSSYPEIARSTLKKNYIYQAPAEVELPEIDLLSEAYELWDAHRKLNKFNQTRLQPQAPTYDWKEKLENDKKFLLLEGQIIDWEIHQIRSLMSDVPSDPDNFMTWYQNLIETGPGQNHPLFNWLSEKANFEQMKWFIQQEVAGEAGFDDLTALTQIKLPTQAKLEVARNYWDEMGKGRLTGMHGPMLADVAQEFELGPSNADKVVPESLALGNVLLGFAANRRYAYHSIGALGAVELTAPGRAKKVYEGLKRLGISPNGQRYYLLHSTLDVKHSQDWNREVIAPLVRDNPSLIPYIAEGALVRLNAGLRCFKRYCLELGLKF